MKYAPLTRWVVKYYVLWYDGKKTPCLDYINATGREDAHRIAAELQCELLGWRVDDPADTERVP